MLLAISNLEAARAQMALSLGFHIVFAALGIGMPVLMLFAEYKANRTGDVVWMALARRWAKGFAILFAVGAVSGTVLSLALSLFWPGFTGRWGGVIGLAFGLEGFAFFIEAIFLGIYLYGWDRLTPWQHWLAGIPVAVSGFASAWFVVAANGWMHAPVGFRLLSGGELVDVDPVRAMLNPAMPVMTTHMVIAAYMCTGLGVAAVYAVGILRGHRDTYHRRALAVGLALGLVLAPIQVVVGDLAGRFVAEYQPVKLAAIEGQWETESHAPEHIGGIPLDDGERMLFVIEIPGLLSYLAYGDPDAVVLGLQDVAPENRPNVLLVHLAFQVMVAIGTALVLLGLWAAASWLRRRTVPTGRWFLRAVLVAGPATFVAVEAGWIVTEVGRQPWIVQSVMRTSEAVTTRPGMGLQLLGTALVYTVLAIGCVWLLRRLARTSPGPVEPPAPPDGAADDSTGVAST